MAQSTDLPIGVWRHHLPNRQVVSVTEASSKTYGATPYGILEYNKQDNSIRKIDKVDGLSDFGISVINYSNDKKLLLIGYQNGNLDVIANGHIFSIPDIRQANIFGSKRINNIYYQNDRAYLSCDFGIVILDLNQFVILDTWFIGPEGSQLNVFDLVNTDDYFFAATEAGLLKAEVNAPNLADFQYWKPTQGLPFGKYNNIILHNYKLLVNLSAEQSDSLYYLQDNEWNIFNPFDQEGYFERKMKIRSSHNKLLVTSNNRVDVFDANMELVESLTRYAGINPRPLDAIVDKDGVYWVGDNRGGLIKGRPQDGFESIVISGPATSSSFRLAHNNGTLWVAPGAIIGGWQPTWNDSGIFLFEKGSWNQFVRWGFPIIDEVRDIHQVTPHIKNPNRVFAASWSGGLIEFDREQGAITLYDEKNSTLQKRAGVEDRIRIGGSAWDSKGNLWVSNSDADHFLSVKKSNGEWLSFPHNGLILGNETLGPLLVDNFDQKWVSMPRGGGIIVFKENSLDNNNSFDIRKITTQAGNGSLPGSTVYSMAMDRDGYIWLGTSGGVVVFYSPQQAFREGPFDAQSIIVMQDEFAGLLFENETINTIVVDGSNKKWFGTRSSGAFLLSADSRETILNFNRNNSPLPSNNILDISIEPNTGEIFFATDQGLVSYRGMATEGGRQHSDIKVYPNPVRPGYNGYIAVNGLVSNARVKITDINGNLIHDTFAEGGQLVWDGKNLFGQKPGSGVYLVFSTDPDGNETLVTKIMYLK